MAGLAQPYPLHEGAEVTDLKEELRRAIRTKRAAMSPRTRSKAAAGLAQVVGDLPQVAAASCVACYASRPSEPGTLPLLERLSARDTQIMLPVLGSGLRRDWAYFTSAEDLQERAPGRPPEPAGPTLSPDALTEAEAIIIPALAVDTAGVRLGQGGGWYDRVLRHAPPEVLLIAIVYPEEIYDARTRPLPTEQHDRPVDIVATPTGWKWLRSPDSPGAG